MSDETSWVTDTECLIRLFDPGDEVWNDVVSKLGPRAEAFARRVGLRGQDIEDAVQEAVFRFSKVYREGRYDRARGRLRTYFTWICKNKILDVLRKNRRRVRDLKIYEGELDQLCSDEPDELDKFVTRCRRETIEKAWNQTVDELRDRMTDDPNPKVRLKIRAWSLSRVDGKSTPEIVTELRANLSQIDAGAGALGMRDVSHQRVYQYIRRVEEKIIPEAVRRYVEDAGGLDE